MFMFRNLRSGFDVSSAMRASRWRINIPFARLDWGSAVFDETARSSRTRSRWVSVCYCALSVVYYACVERDCVFSRGLVMHAPRYGILVDLDVGLWPLSARDVVATLRICMISL